jgi:arsenite-transporting ATPase
MVVDAALVTLVNNPEAKGMTFLANPPRFLFFTGKGGVGKTSIACASAVKLADEGKKVLLVSTDPASNVAQVFGIKIGNQITALQSVLNLSALEIDPQQAAQAYRDRIVGPVRGVLPDAVVAGIEEQLSGACTTEIAAFDQFTALLTDSAITSDFDHILFDTAPTGHTIRLLSLPGAWNTFLDEGKGDASCLGPLSGLEKQRDQYKDAVDALANPARTRLILVTRAQISTLAEVARTHDELADIGLSDQHLIINGVFPDEEGPKDLLAKAIREREQSAIANMPSVLRSLPTDRVLLKSQNMVGLDALRHLLTDEKGDVYLSSIDTKSTIPNLGSLVDDIVKDGHGLVMVMGKGGVGKTTIAGAIAVELALKGFPVHLTTSDPAAHLAETISGELEHLTVSRIDPSVETARYRQHVLETKGAQLDSAGRALLEEDLRSPCTEEIAVFQAFSKVIREAGNKFVVMDTAPTGHTLLLLDATGAYHREVTRQIGDSQVHLLTPMMQLQDPKQTKVLLVTLAETTPVLEAANLQKDLRRAGIEPWAWVINQSITVADTHSRLLLQRAHNEFLEINKVLEMHSTRCALVPLCRDEPVGIERLKQLVRS